MCINANGVVKKGQTGKLYTCDVCIVNYVPIECFYFAKTSKKIPSSTERNGDEREEKNNRLIVIQMCICVYVNFME